MVMCHVMRLSFFFSSVEFNEGNNNNIIVCCTQLIVLYSIYCTVKVEAGDVKFTGMNQSNILNGKQYNT